MAIGLSTVLLGSLPVQGCGSVKPSPPRPRESAQCILDVINLELELVDEGEVEGECKRGLNYILFDRTSILSVEQVLSTQYTVF